MQSLSTDVSTSLSSRKDSVLWKDTIRQPDSALRTIEPEPLFVHLQSPDREDHRLAVSLCFFSSTKIPAPLLKTPSDLSEGDL
jgi:hypothetical protein